MNLYSFSVFWSIYMFINIS